MAARAPKGEVLRRKRATGIFYALRFMAYGEREYVTLGRSDDGWTEKRAQDELQSTLAAVRAGTWRPYQAPEAPPEDPTFHEFASAWFAANSPQWRENTRLDYEWQLRVHLLDFSSEHRLSQITVAEVDRYREHKLAENQAIIAAAKRGEPKMRTYADRTGKSHTRAEQPLSAVSINKTITRLGQILEVAVERELIARNPAKVGGQAPQAQGVEARAHLPGPRRMDHGAPGRGGGDGPRGEGERADPLTGAAGEPHLRGASYLRGAESALARRGPWQAAG